ncbi:MAG: hypothetical protein PHX30_06610, partial [Candidatus Pacebacteria bacterium]|nr:hypothetical protein [Candidatus Paceibacterota bacterium]
MSGQLTSTVATGTAPFVISSTTLVSNLNADLLDGISSGSFLRSDAADVWNDAGSAYDLRFEGDTDPNLLFLDGSADRVGIGTTTPGAKLEVVGSSAGTETVVVYNTQGTYSFTVPAGVTSIKVEAWGAGGSGGSYGGGGGAYTRTDSVSVVSGSNYTVVVGLGSNTTSAGGDSYFRNTSTVMAKGGQAGRSGGSGGAASSSVGSIKYSGGNGADYNAMYSYGGGGGSAGP